MRSRSGCSAREGMHVVVLDSVRGGLFVAARAAGASNAMSPTPVTCEQAFCLDRAKFDALVNCVGGSWEITAKGPARRAAARLPRADQLLARGLEHDPRREPRTRSSIAAAAAAPLLKKQGGAIVNVASVAARKGHSAGRRGLERSRTRSRRRASWGLTRQLALELGRLRRAGELRCARASSPAGG